MRTRADAAIAPSALGQLVAAETPGSPTARLGKVFERTVAPPAPFLEWLLRHPERMQTTSDNNFGASSAEAQEWRRKLFSTDTAKRAEAMAEGLKQFAERGTERSRHEWWAFEGFTHIDCCLVSDNCVLFIEGKRTEAVSPSTRWFQKRSQVWRNVEAAQQFAGGKQFGVVLAVEDVCGDMIDMGSFCDGRPDCWFAMQQSDQQTSGTQTVTIVADACAAAGISKDAIYVRGAALTALVAALELAGRPCEVIVTANTKLKAEVRITVGLIRFGGQVS